jgi:hypothetical protein
MFAFDGNLSNRFLSESEIYEKRIEDDLEYFAERMKLFKTVGLHGTVEYHRIHAEQAVFKAVRDASILGYILMEKTDDFTGHGEQRIAISFCRMLLKIPASREVTQADANEFRGIIEAFQKRMGDPTATQARRMIREASFTIPEISLPFILADHEAQINSLLAAVDSSWYFFYGTKAKHRALLLGTVHPFQYHGTTERFSKKPLIIFDQEIMRSPTWILSNVGTNYQKGYVVRDLSISTIWFNKWASMFSPSEEFTRDMMAEMCREYAIREGIKFKAFKAYGIDKEKDLAIHQDKFISDAKAGVIWHEYGHCISANENIFLPKKMARIGRNISTNDMDAFYPYSEGMADYSPSMEGVYGPIYHICQIAKSDYDRAVGQIYVYLSDYYFFERGETYFQEMTFLIVPLMTRFIDNQGIIDFENLEAQIEPTCQTLADATVRWTMKVLEKLEACKYSVLGVEVTYAELNNYAVNVFRRMYPKYKNETAETIMEYGGHYVNITNLIKKYNPDFHEGLMAYLREITEPMIRDVLSRLNPRYDETIDLRTFCLNELERIGCKYESPSNTSENLETGAYEPEPDQPQWIEANGGLAETKAAVFQGKIKTGRRLGKKDLEILTNQIRRIFESDEQVIVRPENRYNPVLDYIQHLSPDAVRFNRPKTVIFPTPYCGENRSPQVLSRAINKELMRFSAMLSVMPRQSFRGMQINKRFVERLSPKALMQFQMGLMNNRKKIDLEYIEGEKLAELWHDPVPGYYDFQDLINFREYNQLFGFNMHQGAFSVNADWLMGWM